VGHEDSHAKIGCPAVFLGNEMLAFFILLCYLQFGALSRNFCLVRLSLWFLHS
jgi:hypothetical protein